MSRRVEILQELGSRILQGCSLGLDVSVSRQSRDLLFQCLGLGEMWDGLGLGLVSD